MWTMLFGFTLNSSSLKIQHHNFTLFAKVFMIEFIILVPKNVLLCYRVKVLEMQRSMHPNKTNSIIAVIRKTEKQDET